MNIHFSWDGPSKCTMRTAQVNLIEGEKTQEIDARLVITGGDGGGGWDPLQPGWQWKGDPWTLLLSIWIFLSTKDGDGREGRDPFQRVGRWCWWRNLRGGLHQVKTPRQRIFLPPLLGFFIPCQRLARLLIYPHSPEVVWMMKNWWDFSVKSDMLWRRKTMPKHKKILSWHFRGGGYIHWLNVLRIEFVFLLWEWSLAPPGDPSHPTRPIHPTYSTTVLHLSEFVSVFDWKTILLFENIRTIVSMNIYSNISLCQLFYKHIFGHSSV